MKKYLVVYLIVINVLTLALAQNSQTSVQLSSSVKEYLIFLEVKHVDANNSNNVCSDVVQGTAFYISSDGYALTAFHNLKRPERCPEGYTKLRIEGRDGPLDFKVLPAQLVDRDDFADTALLKFPESESGYNYASICNMQTPQAGFQLFSFGFPRGQGFTPLPTTFSTTDGEKGRWVVSSDFTHGMSGGPVTDLQGNVIAFIQGGMPNTAAVRFTVPLRYATNMIELTGQSLVKCGEVRVCETQEADIQQCIANRIADQVNRPFEISGRVRCPGGGCTPFSGNCNHRSTLLNFIAPTNYQIDNYGFTQGASNSGTTGNLNTERDSENRLVNLSIRLTCDPPNYIGAAGGWNAGTLSGNIKIIDKSTIEAEQRPFCVAQVCNQ